MGILTIHQVAESVGVTLPSVEHMTGTERDQLATSLRRAAANTAETASYQATDEAPPPDIQKLIGRINSVLEHGILNGAKAKNLGLTVSQSSDRVGSEDVSNCMYAYSIHQNVAIDYAARASISVAIENPSDGILAKKELDLARIALQTNDFSKYNAFDKEHSDRIFKLNMEQAKAIFQSMPSILDKAFKINESARHQALRLRAENTAMFLMSVDDIDSKKALVDNTGHPLATDHLRVSDKQHNELSLVNTNILKQAIQRVLVPRKLEPYVRQLKIDPGKILFVDMKTQSIDITGNMTPEEKSPTFIQAKNVEISAPDYSSVLERVRSKADTSITHIIRV